MNEPKIKDYIFACNHRFNFQEGEINVRRKRAIYECIQIRFFKKANLPRTTGRLNVRGAANKGGA